MIRTRIAALLVAANALRPQTFAPPRATVRRNGTPAVEIDESRVVGEGSYGVVVAATNAEDKPYVAKRARKDAQSRAYWDVERFVNEKLAGSRAGTPRCIFFVRSVERACS